MPLAILMPVYNEATRLRRTLAALEHAARSVDDVTAFVVDDGSATPVDPEDLPPSTSRFRIVLARHPVNLGQGAALETARQLALAGHLPESAPGFDAFVTMDSDGQHRPEDALALAFAVRGGADVAFGNRFLGHSNVPFLRTVLLRAARLFERALTGLALSDAHNGLRGFSRAALEEIPIRQNRMAHATEIKQRVSRAQGLRMVEVPVSVRYSADTTEKGQHASGAAIIVRDLLHQYLFGEVE